MCLSETISLVQHVQDQDWTLQLHVSSRVLNTMFNSSTCEWLLRVNELLINAS